MAKRTPAPEAEIAFDPAPAFEAVLDAEPDEAPDAAEIESEPRWQWEATGTDAKVAVHGPWRVRVALLGGSGRWRPFVEYAGDDLASAADAEQALERLLS